MSLIKLKKALPYIIVFGLLLGISATMDYISSKLIKPSDEFIAKVQLAESEISKIKLDNFITSTTVSKSISRFGFPIVCAQGSYQTQTRTGNGLWCKDGFSKFYGLSRVDGVSLERLNTYILDNNWQPFGESGSLDTLKMVILSMNDRAGSIFYTNQDNLTATLSIARTDMKHSGTLCTSTLCQLSETEKENYAAIAEISIFYETRPF